MRGQGRGSRATSERNGPGLSRGARGKGRRREKEEKRTVKAKKGKRKKKKENRNETKREAELSDREWEEGYKERRYVCMYQSQDVAGRGTAAQTQNQTQRRKEASEMKLGCESP